MDIRNNAVHESPVNTIMFGDQYEGSIAVLAIKTEFDGYIEFDDGEDVVYVDNENIIGLIAAPQKAVDLGWAR